MNSRKKNKVKHLHHRAMQEINLFKQRVMLAMRFIPVGIEEPKGIQTIFEVLSDVEPDPTFKCTLRFEDLHITKHDIIDLFIFKAILPHDFYQLS